jgi:PAS domain S-box-containing protein
MAAKQNNTGPAPESGKPDPALQPRRAQEPSAGPPAALGPLDEVLALVRAHTRLSFRSYRKKLLTRRIERRMSLGHFTRTADYLAFLREHPNEVRHLARDLMIGVTGFFRDPEAWRAFESEVIAPLVHARDPGRPVRAWCVGCATGEEAYSLGMLLLEQLAAARKNCPVQIFATDVDDDALEVARQAVYPDSITADVSPERLARFFTRAGDLVTFARQDLLADAPFSRLDLIVCRNLLIYLEPEVHKKVLQLLHFALAEGGYLFLGPVETISRSVRLFEPVAGRRWLFRAVGPARAHPGPFPVVQPAPRTTGGQSAGTTRPLEQEPQATREDLQVTIEELETANEELTASNEEFLSMNEELQTVNDDLETSRVELHALNAELTRVNDRLHEKVRELEAASNDMANLFNSTGIATVFLDRGLRIKRFTPAATRLFRIRAADVGRPLGDVARRFLDDDLLPDARQFLDDLTPREKEVRSDDGRWFTRRVVPYRTLDDRIDGVVLAFEDVTERKLAADAVVRRLAAIVESSADAIFSTDLDGTIRTWNEGAERVYGYSRDEAVGQSVKLLYPEERVEELASIMNRIRRGESVERLETERVREGGQRIPVAQTVSPIRDSNGQVVSASIIARDMSERRRAERALRDREERLRAILNTVEDSIITIDQRGVIQAVNPATERMFGYATAKMIGQSVNILLPPPYREEHDGYLARYLRTGEKHVVGTRREVEAQRKDGSIFPAELAVSEIEHLKLFTGIHHEVTRRRQLERDVVQVVSLEQRRIGQDLHDTVAQELTALNLLAGELAEALRTDPAGAADLVERIGRGLRRGQRELRTVLRGLLPVAVDSEGLMAALTDLALRTHQEAKVACTFDCPTPISVADNVTATHLYLIAQEAVHNALKHGRPRNVRISLRSNHLLVLCVQDDGTGMPARPTSLQGLGLRIMRNRAAILGAQLTIEPAAHGHRGHVRAGAEEP